MTPTELRDIVNTEFEYAIGTGDDLATTRQRAWERFLGEPMGNEVEGQSQEQTSDVSDVLDGMLPSLLRLFTTADNLVMFDPVGEEDVEQAQQETDYVQHVFFKKSDAFLIMFYWFFDALLQKNGYVGAWWDESAEVTEERYSNKSIEEITVLLDDPELEPIDRSENEDGTHNVRFRRTVQNPGRIHIEPIPPSEMRVSRDSRWLELDRQRMVGRERQLTRSDLVLMGFDREQVDDLPAENPQQHKPRAAGDPTAMASADRSQDFITVRECYLRVDFDDDGVSELRQIWTANNELLTWADDGRLAIDAIDRQPYHTLSAYPLPHRHIGLSIDDKIGAIQDTTTTLLRQALNNLYHTNMPGHAVWEGALTENTLDDLLTTNIGAIRRFGRPIGEAYQQMTVPFTAQHTFPVLEYFDERKRDRTGVDSDGQGLSAEALKHVQISVMAEQLDLSRMKIEQIARIFAETGIKSLFRHIHELVLKHEQKQRIVRLRNQFVAINPGDWRTREDMTVNIGLGIGTREARLRHLDAIWQKQTEMVQGGGMNLTVTPQNIYNTAREFVMNADMMAPELFFTDPQGQPAPPPSDLETQLQQQQQELEARRQQLDAQRNEIQQAKVQLDAQEQQLEHERELMKLDQQRQRDQASFEVENEKLRHEIARIELELAKKQIEDLTALAGIENTRADTLLKRSQTAKTMEEARGVDLQNDADESGLLELVEDMNNGGN